MQPPPPLLENRQPEWLLRNWKWVVPALTLVVLLGFGVLMALILGVLKSSDAYRGAVERARNAPGVIAALGTPIEPGFLVTGNIKVKGESGTAQLEIPVSGPKGSARIYVSATKSLGSWHFPGLVVQLDGSQQLFDLSEKQERLKPASVGGQDD